MDKIETPESLNKKATNSEITKTNSKALPRVRILLPSDSPM
jgi:hypothetical protein